MHAPDIDGRCSPIACHCAPRRARVRTPFAIALLLTLLACVAGDSVTPSLLENGATAHDATLSSVSSDDWRNLATKRIFFGHQSVGAQLVEGMRAIAASHPEYGLRILDAAHPGEIAGPAIMHAVIGTNYDPASKSAAFLATLHERAAPDIALYKFCYVDVTPATDPDALFADYVRTVERAQAEHPGMTIVHVTMPLTTAAPPGGVKSVLRRILGRGPITEVENNVKRNRYNDLLRARYGGGRAPLFDLAAIESTRPDGSRSRFAWGADSIDTLASELSSDGGHLNAAGQRAAAERLLVFLARL